jgi:hypothetical protein
VFQLILSISSFGIHLLSIRELKKNFMSKQVIKLTVGIEGLLFAWLFYGYIAFFGNGCDESTDENELVFSNILLMQDVRCLRAITLAIFVVLCGPCFLTDMAIKYYKKPRPEVIYRHLNTLPVKEIVPSNYHETSCAICLDLFKEREKAVLLPCDNHFFHEPCIKGWLKVNNACPECR